MKRVNQFERTDRDITNALLNVMDQKAFEKITVQDILDEAMVNRSTFYQHFSDKYAILERLQEKLIGGITERLDALREKDDWDQSEVDRVFYEYLAAHRQQMEMLLSVRSENLDLEGQMCALFERYLHLSGCGLNELERSLLAELTVSFFVYHIRKKTDLQELSGTMLETWLNMCVYFFRIDQVPDAKDRLLGLIGELHNTP